MPGEWKSERLSALCEQIADCPHSTPLWTDSGALVLRSQNIRNGRLDLSAKSYTDEVHFEQRSRRARLRGGDLVITREAPMGEVCLIPDGLRCCLGQRMVMLRPDPKKCDSRFLLYSIQSRSVQDEIKVNEGTGSTVSNLRIPLLEALPIPHPPLAEQKAIAAVLGALDDKIELNRRMNATLEAMARALFQSWFVDFDPVRAKLDGRPPSVLDPATAALFPAAFHDSPLGPIPHGWEVCPLSEKIQLLSGGTPKTSEPTYWDGDIPWYSVRDAPSETDVWVIHTDKHVTKLGIANSAAQIFPEKTTIISARGTVGKLALTAVPMAMNQSCYGVRGITGYGDYFTYYSLREATAQLQQRTHGTVFDTITTETFKTLDCIFPTPKIIAAFDKLVEPLLGQIRANLHQSRTLATLRDTLLPKLLSGTIDISNLNSP
jgi:type I restriction enzyme S subunit